MLNLRITTLKAQFKSSVTELYSDILRVMLLGVICSKCLMFSDMSLQYSSLMNHENNILDDFSARYVAVSDLETSKDV
jgi:hypothetical protein